MRNITLLCLLIATSVCSFAQDIIVLKDNNIIRAKILEVGYYEVIYKKFNYEDGPIFTVAMSDIAMIKYANGDIDSNKLFFYIHDSAPTIGIGLGLDYGILGVRYNHKLGEKNNFGYHLGLGYGVDFSFAGGMKYYFIKETYIDITASLSPKWVKYIYGCATIGGDYYLSNQFGLNINGGVAFDFKDEFYPAVGLGFFYKL